MEIPSHSGVLAGITQNYETKPLFTWPKCSQRLNETKPLLPTVRGKMLNFWATSFFGVCKSRPWNVMEIFMSFDFTCWSHRRMISPLCCRVRPTGDFRFFCSIFKIKKFYGIKSGSQAGELNNKKVTEKRNWFSLQERGECRRRKARGGVIKRQQ